MAANNLNGKRVAILATDGFEQSELMEPRNALMAAGAVTKVISPATGKIRGWQHKNWGEEIGVDLPLEEARAQDFDALLLPGGVMNPDKLRTNEKAVRFVQEMFAAGKPIAAICHGPWLLVDAGVVKGRNLTSYHTLATDLRNAGANWSDQEVVVDQGFVTSRKPDDLPAFNDKVLEEIAEGEHAGQTA